MRNPNRQPVADLDPVPENEDQGMVIIPKDHPLPVDTESAEAIRLRVVVAPMLVAPAADLLMSIDRGKPQMIDPLPINTRIVVLEAALEPNRVSIQLTMERCHIMTDRNTRQEAVLDQEVALLQEEEGAASLLRMAAVIATRR